MGAPYANELHAMKVQDGCIQVSIPVTKTKVLRSFTIIIVDFCNTVNRCADLRRQKSSPNYFFFEITKTVSVRSKWLLSTNLEQWEKKL
mgnify:CR=1 FL=1